MLIMTTNETNDQYETINTMDLYCVNRKSTRRNYYKKIISVLDI